MPKSRRRKGKFSPQSKKRREQVGQPATPKPPLAAQTGQPVPPPKIVTPPPSTAPTAKAAAVPTTSHNITTELKTIGMLAGTLLVILIVLALFLT
jgi:hypothetical protein